MVTIFLDEAGDLGFDFENKKPSTHFCITLLVCRHKNTVSALKSVVKNTLVRKFNHKKTKEHVIELKGTNTNFEVKRYFYEQLENFHHPLPMDIEIHTIVFNKREIVNPINAKQNHHKFYNFVAKEILDAVDFSDVENQVNLYVDRSKGSEERQIFDTYIKAHLEIKLPVSVNLKIRHERSHELAGLQAVDLFCYGISRKYSFNDKSWYDLFKSKIKNEIEWKPKI